MTNFGSHLVDMIVDCVRRDNKVFFIKKLTLNNKKLETKTIRMKIRILKMMMRMMMVIRVGRI